MAHKIAAFPKSTRRSKYDVAKWFDGNIWKLVQGEDFDVPIPSFRGSLYNQAGKKGFEIRTQVSEHDGAPALVIQQVGQKDPRPAPAKKAPAKKAAAKS